MTSSEIFMVFFLILMGAAVLLYSLAITDKILRLLKTNSHYTQWKTLAGFILFILLAYLLMAGIVLIGKQRFFPEIAGTILFLGAAFILLVLKAGYLTINHSIGINEKLQTEIGEHRKAEQALSESENRFRTFSQNSEEGLAIHDKGKIIVVNERFAKMLGYSTMEVLGRTAIEFCPDKWKDIILKNISSGTELPYEAEGLRKDRSVFPVEIQGKSIVYHGQNVRLTIFRDISRIKKAEKEVRKLNEQLEIKVKMRTVQLAESEEKYRTLIEQAGDVVYSTDYSGKFTYINPMCEKLTGFSKEEIIGKHFLELIPPEWKLKVADFYQLQFKNRTKETLFSFPILTKSGDQKWIEQTVLQLRDNGRVTGHHCIVRDITERKKAEDQIRDLNATLEKRVEEKTKEIIEREERLIQSEEKFRLMIENSPNAIIVVDKKGEINLVNHQAEIIFGYNRVELMDQKIELLIPERFRNKHPEHRKGFLANPESMYLGKGRDLFGLKKDGNEIPVEIGLAPFQTSDGLHVLASIVDISSRKKAEDEIKRLNENLENKVKERTAELDAFTSSVSHDLRAPVRAISGFATIIKKDYSDKLDEQANKLFETIVSESIRMGRLIDDLLTFSRMSKTELIKSPVDMLSLANTTIEEVLKISEEKYKAKFIIKDLPGANGDPALLKQVFVNLISNALKFSANRTEPAIEIGAIAGNDEITYYVQDNGVGFDMKYYNKLFGIFQRLHAAEDFKGTGIGLAIVKRVITRHGGKVWAEGKVNEGATFYFSLLK